MADLHHRACGTGARERVRHREWSGRLPARVGVATAGLVGTVHAHSRSVPPRQVSTRLSQLNFTLRDLTTPDRNAAGLIGDRGGSAPPGAPINGWTARWTLASGQTISQLWNGTLVVSGSAATVRNVSWIGSLDASATATFGFLAGGSPSTQTVTCISP
ncbi:cellulose binding domain-containing protein [Micromonospora sp. CA-263727]|uniref:cellulose binding domain-containing protein n=1 Tax=Micromonospora sp. CA-263727 TaxID=3239967 RepID=UPI003D8B9288